MSDAQRDDAERDRPDEPVGAEQNPEEVPDSELTEPSTEKDPGEEPRGGSGQDEEPSHHAVGIGVIDAEIPGEE